MIGVDTVFSRHLAPEALPGAVRTAVGKPLRRASPLTQLALIGALACLPPDRRDLPTALLWQSTSGARSETLILLDEICRGSAEPMPYDFLATQPAIAAAQILPFLPGLQTAIYLPLEQAQQANWSLLFHLAADWLNRGRYAQVLCAQFDYADTAADMHCLSLSAAALENRAARLHLSDTPSGEIQPDTPDFPARLAKWLARTDGETLSLHAPFAMKQAVEFTRL